MQPALKSLAAYLTENYPQRKLYFAATLYSPFFEDLKNDMYLIGVAFQYSAKRIDNIAVLKRNLTQRYRLDYLEYDWYDMKYPVTKLVRNLHKNYIHGFVKYAEHAQLAGDTNEARYWKSQAMKLAERVGSKTYIEFVKKLDF